LLLELTERTGRAARNQKARSEQSVTNEDPPHHCVPYPSTFSTAP
jgi:hypothetical protein